MKEPTMLYKPKGKGYETVVIEASDVKKYEKKGWKDEPPKAKKDVKRD